MPNRQSIVLTGAAGRVAALLRPILRRKFHLILNDLRNCNPQDDEVQILGDLSDAAFCATLTQGAKGLVHMAALVGPTLNFEETLDPNYRSVLNLLEACRSQSIERFVFASSHHILGMLPSSSIYTEASPLAPDGYYGLSKAFGEAACSMYAHRFGMKCLLLRIGNADPAVTDGRRERIWTSDEDLAQLIEIGLTHPIGPCDVVYGVSNCTDPLFENSVAYALGYEPQAQAVDHRAANFQARSQLDPADIRCVGGFFATSTLPEIRSRTS